MNENKKHENTFPTIAMSNRQQLNMSAWFNEKIHKVLVETSNLINEIPKLTANEKSYKRTEEIIYNLLKLVVMISDRENKTDHYDEKIILEKGYKGYVELMKKYDINNDDLNLIFIRD